MLNLSQILFQRNYRSIAHTKLFQEFDSYSQNILFVILHIIPKTITTNNQNIFAQTTNTIKYSYKQFYMILKNCATGTTPTILNKPPHCQNSLRLPQKGNKFNTVSDYFYHPRKYHQIQIYFIQKYLKILLYEELSKYCFMFQKFIEYYKNVYIVTSEYNKTQAHNQTIQIAQKITNFRTNSEHKIRKLKNQYFIYTKIKKNTVTIINRKDTIDKNQKFQQIIIFTFGGKLLDSFFTIDIDICNTNYLVIMVTRAETNDVNKTCWAHSIQYQKNNINIINFLTILITIFQNFT
eukprot:TRINITY_DN6400_c0_g1_i9.p1 TRINITY_DN6400_c0_g1~~TRINITY_DN6400_c0_g1_i9.p1  ORF type:complete len:293 (+),score=-30.21 TRINITY_DN6400_c0_g1_i9:164-1042(+)